MIELVGNSILALIVVVVLVSLWRFHQDEHYKRFNLVDVITAKDGRISRPAVQEFGAWIIASWYLIIEANRGESIEAEFGLYLGSFVARAAHAAYMNAQAPNGEKLDAPAKPTK